MNEVRGTFSGPVTRREHIAAGMLLFACVIWGMSFNWSKQAQAILGDRLAAEFARPEMVRLGPVCFLILRFLAAAVLWALLFPQSRKTWNAATIRGGFAGGFLLAAGMLLQHYGLAYTSESLSAFLTSLTVLFTPILAILLLRQRVSGWLWASVFCATLGVSMMTLYGVEAGFDIGALLGLLCALVFSGHILVVDYFGKRQDMWRFALAQFTSASAVFIAFAAVFPSGHRLSGAAEFARAAGSMAFLGPLALTVVLSTLLTFGLMFRYQPDLSATRAALMYLSEPIFATAYAWLVAGTSLTLVAALGALLILLGNAIAELRGRPSEQSKQGTA